MRRLTAMWRAQVTLGPSLHALTWIAKRPRHEEEFEKNVRAAEKMYIRMYLPSEVHLARRVGCSGQKIKYVSAPVTPGCPTLEVGAQLGMLESSLNDRIRVRALPANDPHGPFGAFAGRDFKAGDEIGVYGGALVRYYRLPDGDLDTSSAQVKTDGCYRLTLFDGRTYAVCLEADTYCNETAFINHNEGRGIQNCEFKTPNDALLSSRVYALRDIREGEELLINYGDSYFNQTPDTVDAPAQPPVPKRPRTARRQESSASSAPTSVQTARVSVPSSSIPYALPVQSVPSALPAPSALPDFSARIGDWRAFGPQTQRVVAALVKDTTCVLVGKRYEDSRGNCVEKSRSSSPAWAGQRSGWPSPTGRLRRPSSPAASPSATPDLRCLSELSFDILRLFPEKDVDIMEGLGWGSFPTLDEIDPDCAGAASGGESTPDSPADTALVAAPPPPPEGARVGPWTYLLLADITDASSQVVGPLKHSAPVSSFADAYGFPASPSHETGTWAQGSDTGDVIDLMFDEHFDPFDEDDDWNPGWNRDSDGTLDESEDDDDLSDF
eukprot:jgi/Mesvir1/5748/Mv01993-RA.1